MPLRGGGELPLTRLHTHLAPHLCREPRPGASLPQTGERGSMGSEDASEPFLSGLSGGLEKGQWAVMGCAQTGFRDEDARCCGYW